MVVSGCRAPGGDAVPGQRDVDGLLDEDPLVALLLELGLPGGQRLGDGAAGQADALAGLGLGGRRQGADLPVGQRQRRPVAGVLEAGGLERVEVGGLRDRGQRVVAGVLDLVGVQGGHLHGVVGLVRVRTSGAPSLDRATSESRAAAARPSLCGRRTGDAGSRRSGRRRRPPGRGLSRGSRGRRRAARIGTAHRRSGPRPTSMWPPCASTRPRTM